MSGREEKSAGERWQCFHCRVPLERDKVVVTYLGSEFPVDLLRCPQCGLAFVPQDLALGKMLEVEKALEDK